VLLGEVNTYLPAFLATQYVQFCGKIQIKPLVKEPPKFVDCVPTAALDEVGRETTRP